MIIRVVATVVGETSQISTIKQYMFETFLSGYGSVSVCPSVTCRNSSETAGRIQLLFILHSVHCTTNRFKFDFSYDVQLVQLIISVADENNSFADYR